MNFRKLKKRLQNNFGKIPDRMYFEGDMAAIKSYYDFRKENDLDEFLVDDITWNDLNMDRVFKRINLGMSTSGEQYLYYELRSPTIDSDKYRERKKLIDLMTDFPKLRLNLQVILSRLGKTRRANLTRTFHPTEHGFKWLIIYFFLVLLVPLALVSVTLFGPAALLGCFAVLGLNACIHEIRLRKCQSDFDTVNYTVSLAMALNRIRKLKNGELDQYLQDSYEHLDRLRSVIRTGGLSGFSDGGLGDLLATVFLVDLITYEFLKNKLSRCQSDVFAIHESLGKIDSAIAVVSYRQSLETFAEPVIDFSSTQPNLRACDMFHPLLKDPVPNSLDTNRSILITGSNASGKSTFLKTVALNAILSQSICTAAATSYQASLFRIYSSMALSDDLLAGESYYIVETKSLKRILNEIDGKVPLLCTIDEVLRGTNTIERIAASSKILESIAQSGALCLAATHDIELCDLLPEQYDMYHFEEQLGEDEMVFDYRIRNGKAVSRNAINLLKLIGFENNIVEGAHERANRYVESGIWS